MCACTVREIEKEEKRERGKRGKSERGREMCACRGPPDWRLAHESPAYTSSKYTHGWNADVNAEYVCVCMYDAMHVHLGTCKMCVHTDVDIYIRYCVYEASLLGGHLTLVFGWI